MLDSFVGDSLGILIKLRSVSGDSLIGFGSFCKVFGSSNDATKKKEMDRGGRENPN
jgi:hypothetical protein